MSFGVRGVEEAGRDNAWERGRAKGRQSTVLHGHGRQSAQAIGWSTPVQQYRMDGGGLPMVNYLLQHTLRSLCSDSQWVYAVFWRILPRNYPPPKWDTEGGILDRSKGNKRNWILVWEDGYCDFGGCARAAQSLSNRCSTTVSGEEDKSMTESFQPELFFKMSHEVYNYGEGLMGKVAADNSHKWVYKEPPENDINFLSSWHGSLDPHPRTWESQFKSGIQTIAVVAVREGLIQLGSLHKIVEDLNFVIFLQRKFNYLQSIPGVFAMHPPLSFDYRKPKMIPNSSSPVEESLWVSGFSDERLAAAGMPNLPMPQHSNYFPPDNVARRKTHSPTKETSQIVGMKRPPDQLMDTAPTKNSMNYGCNLSPNKAINAGWNSPQRSMVVPSLMPSMSSLQALLSKLPSVTSPEQSHIQVLGPVNNTVFQRPSSFNGRHIASLQANPLMDTSEANSFQKSCLTLNSTADPLSAHSPSAADVADSKLHVNVSQEASSPAHPSGQQCSQARDQHHTSSAHGGLCSSNFLDSCSAPLEFAVHGEIENNDDGYSLLNQIIS
eukprot:Gb_06730 [translate_table: standard]